MIRAIRPRIWRTTNVLMDAVLKFFLATGAYDHRADVSATLQQAHDGNFILAASTSDDASLLVLMHVACLAADECFVDF